MREREGEGKTEGKDSERDYYKKSRQGRKKQCSSRGKSMHSRITYLISLKLVLFASFQMVKATDKYDFHLASPSMTQFQDLRVPVKHLLQNVRWPSINQGNKMAPGIKDWVHHKKPSQTEVRPWRLSKSLHHSCPHWLPPAKLRTPQYSSTADKSWWSITQINVATKKRKKWPTEEKMWKKYPVLTLWQYICCLIGWSPVWWRELPYCDFAKG